MVCGTIIYIAVVGDFGVCHADCHEVDCGKATFYMGCSSGMSARLFPEKETGERVGAGNGPSGWIAEGQQERDLPQWAMKRISIHHSVSDRASLRTRIALGTNHHVNGVTLKVLVTWAAVNDSAVKFLSTAVDNFGQDPNFRDIASCGLNYPPVEISGFPQTGWRDSEIFNMRSIQTGRLRSPV